MSTSVSAVAILSTTSSNRLANCHPSLRPSSSCAPTSIFHSVLSRSATTLVLRGVRDRNDISPATVPATIDSVIVCAELANVYVARSMPDSIT